MSAGATPAACVPRPVRTPQAPMSARAPPAFAYPAMARTVKVRVLMGVRKCFRPCVRVRANRLYVSQHLHKQNYLRVDCCLYSDQACICVSTAADTKAGHCTAYH